MKCSKKLPLIVVVSLSTDQNVFCDLEEFFSDKFSNIETYWYTCDLNIDFSHYVYSNNCSLLYFRRFLAEIILSINLKVHFPR